GGAKPVPHGGESVTSAVTIVRTEPTADASLAAMRARSKFGIAIAAMIKIIATTMSNSISEKPFWFLFIVSPGSSAPDSVSYALAGYGSDRSTDRSKSAHSVYFWNTPTHHHDLQGDTPRR